MTLLKPQFIARKPTLVFTWNGLACVQLNTSAINLVICLLEPAYRICNSYMSNHFEFQLISFILLNNEYPRRFIDFSCDVLTFAGQSFNI